MAVKFVKYINLICRSIHSKTTTNNPAQAENGSCIYLDANNYDGTVSYYFEVVALNTSGSNETTNLYKGTSIPSTIITSPAITIQANTTSFEFFRSAAVTIDNNYKLKGVGISATGSASDVQIKSARLVIVQSDASAITDTETQIELGDYEANYTWGDGATSDQPLTYPKYWYYDSSKFDGTVTFEAHCTYFNNDNKAKCTVTIQLQKDDGSFSNWTDVTTIVNASSTAGFVFARQSTDFSASMTSGRNYRLALTTTNYKYGDITIYNAKIVVKQTDASELTKTETVLTLLNSDSATTGLQDCDGYYDADEWDGVTVNIYPEHDASGSGSNTKLQEDTDGAPSDVSNSSITGANRQRGATALSITDNEDIDTYIVTA